MHLRGPDRLSNLPLIFQCDSVPSRNVKLLVATQLFSALLVGIEYIVS